CSANFWPESTRSSSDWPCLRRKAGGRQVTRAKDPRSRTARKPPPKVRRTLRSVAWRRGAVKRNTKPSIFCERGWSSGYGPLPSKQMRRVRLPHSAPDPYFADSPTGGGNRTVNPDALRSSRRSAANLTTDATGVAAKLSTWRERSVTATGRQINARLAQTRRASVLQTEWRRDPIC